jgi:hypothetical protein
VPAHNLVSINACALPFGWTIWALVNHTYETIPYHIHCSSRRLWLDDVMRQQEGISDDHQLNRSDHEEGYGCEERDDHEEGGHDHQEDDEKESGRSRVTITYSVTPSFCGPKPPKTHLARAHPFDGAPAESFWPFSLEENQALILQWGTGRASRFRRL